MAADPLSIASAAVSFVGFGGQTLNGVRFLCDFFANVRDAPEDIETIAQELQLIKKILEECLTDAQGSGISDPALKSAVQSCRYWTGKLEKRVEVFGPRHAAGGVRRTWAQVQVAFRNKNIDNTSSQRLNSTLSDIESGLSRLSLDQTAAGNILEETRNTSRNLTDQFKSNLTPAIQDLSSQCLGISSTQATHAIVLSATRESTVSIEQDTAQIKAAVSQLLENGSKDMGLLAALLQPAVEKVITERIDAALRTHSSMQVLETASDPKPSHAHETTSTPVSTQDTDISGLRYLRHKTVTYSSLRDYSVARFWFGSLFITSTNGATCEMNTTLKKARKAEYIETQVMFVPSTWLLRTGAVLSVKWLTSTVSKPSIQVALRPITILTWDNPVFEAIESGNIRKVQELAASGRFRPTDICTNGMTLFHNTLEDVYTSTLPDGQEVWEKFNNDADFEAEPLSSEKEEALLKMLEVCHWLLANGCTSNAPTPSGDDCFEIIHEIIGLDERVCDLGLKYSAEISTLATTMASHAVISPFYRSCGGSLIETNLLKMILEDGNWWYFDELVAENGAADVGALGCLRMLRSLWDCHPYALKEDCFIEKNVIGCLSDFCWWEDQNPEGEIRSVGLLRAAKEEKVWLSGDGSEFSEALKLLYESIRGALFRASLFCHHCDIRDDSYEPGSPRKSLQAHISASIASMLSFDTRVASLAYDGETLTQCASKWRVLDVWACALDKAGENLNTYLAGIPRSTILPLYNNLAFTAGRNRASLYISRDPSNDTCLIVHGHRKKRIRPRMRRLDDPNNETIDKLTKEWPFRLSDIHCEIKTSSNIEIVDTSTESPSIDVGDQWWKAEESETYELRPTGDGGLELFIDYDGEYDPCERLCYEIENDRIQRDKMKAEAETEEPVAKPNQPTLLSKVAKTGMVLLSSIV